LAVVIEGASIVGEYQGVCANVLVYKQRCDACGYLALTNSVVVTILPYGAYDTQGFPCPSCANYQAVRIRLELAEEVADLLISEE
jgi:hypothetical protein